jgi:predicted TIM-barrel fold metal-dependent hydrolase
MRRRDFLATSATLLLTPHAHASPVPGAGVDTHVHFYDPTRPQGVPWPKPGSPLYRRVMPADYAALAGRLGIRSVIVVEASPWLEDNQWLLDLAQRETLITGVVGNLSPGDDNFASHLARFTRSPYFRGIRIGGPTLLERIADPRFIADLHRVADADLSVDLNGSPDMLRAIVKLAAAVPNLRIVIDHFAGCGDPRKVTAQWRDDFARAAAHPSVFAKVSGLPEQAASPTDRLDDYLPVLEHAWQTFGEDRLLFGSNRPVCEKGAPLATVHRLITDWLTTKPAAAREKILTTNAHHIYKPLAR